MCLQPEAAPLEGLARRGSEACLLALRKCSPTRPPPPRSISSSAQVQSQRPSLPPGDRAAYQHVTALLGHISGMPFLQGAGDPTVHQGSAGNKSEAKFKGAQLGWCALDRVISSSCLTGSASADASPLRDPAPPDVGPGVRPQRPAWLEQAARRIAQGINLRSRASHEGSSSPGISYPESLPAALAALGVAQHSAA